MKALNTNNLVRFILFVMVFCMLPYTLVYATDDNYALSEHASPYVSEEYTVVVPMTMTPGQTDVVKVYGTWAKDRVVTVTASNSVELVNSIDSNDKEVLAVTFDGIKQLGNGAENVSVEANISIAAMPPVLFGSWSGVFSYDVNIATIQISIPVSASNSDGVDLIATSQTIIDEERETLLEKLEDNGLINDADEVDALIEVESDDFDGFAKATFDVSSIAQEGDKVVVLHFDKELSQWEFIDEKSVEADGTVTVDFTSFSPVAFVVINPDGTAEIIETVNRYGFYFNKPYQLVIDGVLTEYIFYKYGSASVWKVIDGAHSGYYIPQNTCVYGTQSITINGQIFSVSEDGKTLTVNDGISVFGLHDVEEGAIRSDVSYRNATNGTSVIFKNDGSVEFYEGEALSVAYPAGSVEIKDNYFYLTRNSQTEICPIYPSGVKIMIDESVFVIDCGHETTAIRDVAPTCGDDGMDDAKFCRGCGIMINAGTPIPATGNHVATTLKNEKAATCIDNGYTGDRICNACGEIAVNGSVITALGHGATEIRDSVDATCTSTGYSGDTYCTVCNTKILNGETVDTLSHTYVHTEDWSWTEFKSASTTFVCANCPAKKTAGATIAVVTQTPATCTTDGQRVYTATATFEGKTYTNSKPETIAALGHSHTTTVTKPTCTSGGYTTYTCHCGDTYIGNHTEQLGHALGDWTITKSATCTKTGSQRRDCSRCDHYETSAIPAKGHGATETRDVVNASCTTTGYTGDKYCTVCGTKTEGGTTIDALGHVDVDSNDACDRCGHILVLYATLQGQYSSSTTITPEVYDRNFATDNTPRAGRTLGGYGLESFSVYCLKFVTPDFVDGTDGKVVLNMSFKAIDTTTSSLNYAICSSHSNIGLYGDRIGDVSEGNQIEKGAMNWSLSNEYSVYTTTINTSKLTPNTTYYLILWANDESDLRVNTIPNHSIVIRP